MPFSIRSLIRRVSFPLGSVPIALLLLMLLSYGLRVPGLGFFWDDLPYLWFFQRLGAAGIWQAFTVDRPFLSVLYITCLSILGNSAVAWQIFAMLARWLTSLGFYWMFAQTWPRHRRPVAWAAFLFAVYPGFTQQYIAVIYGQAFVLFAAALLSIGITLWLARRAHALQRGWFLAGFALSLALSIFHVFSTEYFFGMEMLRPLLLWIVFVEQAAQTPFADATAAPRMRQAFWRAVRWWLPYLIGLVIFVIWRTFFHSVGSYRLSALQSTEQAPLVGLWNLALTMFSSLVQSIVVAWGQPLQLSSVIEGSDAANLGGRLFLVILAVGLMTFFYLLRLRQDPARAIPERRTRWQFLQTWPAQASLVSIYALLIAGWPFWITNLPLRMGFPQDRFTLPLSVGACLLLAAVLDSFGKNAMRKAALLALLVALAVGFHFQTALQYRTDWNTARDFFWQLTWRAPSIQPNTLLLSDSLPFQFYEDDSLSAPLNWTYDPTGNTNVMSYLLFDILVRYHDQPAFSPEKPIEKDFRGMQFRGNAGQVLLVAFNPPGCVRVLDPRYDADLYRLPDRLLKSMNLSNPSALIRDAQPGAQPPIDIFGDAPRRRWCYYFEKADLARQQGDWPQIVTLAKESIAVGLRPDDPAEYLPFIEGDLHSGRWEDALERTLTTYQVAPALRPALCAVWLRTAPEQRPIAGAEAVYAQADARLACPTP